MNFWKITRGAKMRKQFQNEWREGRRQAKDAGRAAEGARQEEQEGHETSVGARD